MPKHQGRHQKAGQAAQAGQGGRGGAAARHHLVLLVAVAVAEASLAEALAAGATALDAWGSSGVTAGQVPCRRGDAEQWQCCCRLLSEPGRQGHTAAAHPHATHMHTCAMSCKGYMTVVSAMETRTLAVSTHTHTPFTTTGCAWGTTPATPLVGLRLCPSKARVLAHTIPAHHTHTPTCVPAAACRRSVRMMWSCTRPALSLLAASWPP